MGETIMRCESSEKEKIRKNRKGLWSPDEDQKLRDYILNHGVGCWSFVPLHAGLQRNGKSCRLRWINYLRPGLKRGTFTSHEEEIIMTLHSMLGNKWSQMSHHLPGRTDNEIKNHWHSYLKKKKVQNLDTMKSQDRCNLDTQNKQTPSSSRADSSFESPKAHGYRNSPKILFADWLSLDQFHKCDFSGSRRTDDEVVNGFDADSLDHLQMIYDHQQVETELYDLISPDNNIMCQNFNDSDAMLYKGCV